MLDNVFLGDFTLGPVAFPSLIYLSLYNVDGLKPYIDAPSLITYHEGGRTISESFSARLPSLIEYGVHGLHASNLHLAQWHLIFPNILRLSVRAQEDVLSSCLDSLANQPHLLPVLQTISVRNLYLYGVMLLENIEKMEGMVRVRGKACGKEVVLHIEKRSSIRIPMFFGDVSGSLSNGPELC